MIRVRRPFVQATPIPVSKSWLNRALILKSLHPDIRIVEWEPSELDGDDVTKLRLALERLDQGETEFDVGESGTGLRFLIARLSVEVGRYRIRASQKLLKRPHGELFRVLENLGTKVNLVDSTTLDVHSIGWPVKSGDESKFEIAIDASESSQFASALYLAASGQVCDFSLKLTGNVISRGYLDMTLKMIEGVKRGRKVLIAETDASSVATLACLAVAAADHNRKKAILRLESQTWPTFENELTKTLSKLKEKVETTVQPDRAVFNSIEVMRTPGGLRSVEIDLSGAPDLFPVLAALAAFAKGTSRFSGAPHLRLKESDRIAGLSRLFQTVGILHTEHHDGMTVRGISSELERDYAKRTRQGLPFLFDPDSDHRLAFAAAVLAAGGVPIEVQKRGVVQKSFPMFWSMIEGDAPRVVLIGQRGTGKTEAAKRWARQLGGRATLIDLDREVERLAGRSIDDVFRTMGETEFRWFERQAWREVDVETRNSFGAVLVAVGAGFNPELIDDSWTRVWLRRSTDDSGRIFTDRPRLDQTLHPLEEFHHRATLRAPRFQAVSDRSLTLGEGSIDASEQPWFTDLLGIEESESISRLGGTVTLLAHHNISESCERWLRWGVSRIEIRDDQWSPAGEPAAWDFFVKLPAGSCLISFRAVTETSRTIEQISRWLNVPSSGGRLAVDWPLDRSLEVPSEILNWAKDGLIELVASVHGEAEDISVEALARFEAVLQDYPRAVLKVALKIADFKTLIPYHNWAAEKSKTRILLPMSVPTVADASRPGCGSSRARWAWYRSLMCSSQPHGLSFWREDEGSSLDQPTFSQWWRRRRFTKNEFAAVLGSPVAHSRTPLEHDSYFTGRGWPVFSIQVDRDEVSHALPFLQSLGLKAAAVTSPLKELIVAGASINTIAFKAVALKGEIMTTTNTDIFGFQKLWQSTEELRNRLSPTSSTPFAPKPVVVWGGGGVLPAISATLRGAVFYSAQSGEPRSGIPVKSPEIVVWASGQTKGAWPLGWRPRLVIDLSYTEDSMGRAVALEAGARYVSGLVMFEAQAACQREFWTKEL